MNAPAVTPASILIVEDEAIVALDLQAQLEDMGYQVCGIADRGEDAIAQAWGKRPRLILMDIVIKGEQDGVQVAEQLLRGLQVPVIYLTAYSDDLTVSRAAHTAPYGYLTKPFQARELHAAIEVALHKAALERSLRESEQWFAATLRCVNDGIIATDAQGRVRLMNPAAEAMLGWTEEEARGCEVKVVAPMSDPRTGLPLESPVERALHSGRTVGIEFGTLLQGRAGARPIDDSCAVITDGEGGTLGVVMAFRDVQVRVAFEEKLRQSEEFFRSIFDYAPVGMALIGLDNRVLRANGAICELLGYQEAELIGVSQERLAPSDSPEAERRMLEEILGGKSMAAQFEKRYRTQAGKFVATLVSVSLLQRQHLPLCYLWQIHDITERKNAENRLARLAHFDPLTGLANRAHLSDEIERNIVLAHRHATRFAVVFIDLDHFKQVNDTLGHEAGDALLKAFAEKLRGALRAIDTAARLGGDEFVLLLPEIGAPEDVLAVTNKLREVCALPVAMDGEDVAIGLSMGVSLFPDDAEDARSLLRYADSALYHAKAEGRNNLQFYRHELMAAMQERAALGAALRLALERGQFELFYQPIVALDNGQPIMAEALIRWRHPERGLLLPDVFIGLAEEMGLSEPIGAWVLRTACQAAAEWQNGGRQVVVSVNVSPRQFKDGKLVHVVRAALADSGLEAQRLCIEITEQVMFQHTAENLAVVARLKALGVRIAIDDFGVGYASLSYISRIVPSEIKIDCSLVREVDRNPFDAAIVRAAIVMARSLNLTVVTEGVETAAQRQFLHSAGCELAQGFLFARPLSNVDFTRWLLVRPGW